MPKASIAETLDATPANVLAACQNTIDGFWPEDAPTVREALANLVAAIESSETPAKVGLVDMRRTEARLAANVQAFIEAAVDPKFEYSHARSWRASGIAQTDGDYYVTVYHRELGHCGGIVAACRLSHFAMACGILERLGRPSPLSPTEGLRKS